VKIVLQPAEQMEAVYHYLDRVITEVKGNTIVIDAPDITPWKHVGDGGDIVK